MPRHIGFLLALICATQPALAWQPGTPLALLQPPPFVGNVNGSQLAGLPLPQADINCVTRQAYQNGVWGDPVNFINMVRALPAYAPDNSGNYQRFPASVTGTGGGALRENNQGCLSETASTNNIRNSSASGAAVGTPGTNPNNWSFTNPGLNRAIAATGTESGLSYVDVNWNGSSVNGGIDILFESNTQMAASNSQTWTFCVFWKLTPGSALTNITSATLFIDMFNSGGSFLGQLSQSLSPPGSAALGLSQISATQTLNQSTTAFVNAYIAVGYTVSSTINTTLRFAQPQMENRVGCTSPIVTTNAAVTRPADVGTLTVAPAFGGAFTGYASGTPNDPTSFTATQTPLQIDEGDNNSRWDIDRGANSGQFGVGLTIATAAETPPSGGPPAIWTPYGLAKTIYAIDPGSQSAASNLISGVLTAAGAGTFAASRVDFGWGANANHQFDGNVQRIEVFASVGLPASILPYIAAGNGP